MKKICLVATMLVATTLSLCAQDIISLGDTTIIDASEAPMSAPVIMAEGWNQTKTKFFTLNIGLALILDHNIVVQDDTNIEQVGDVAPGTEFRGERLILSGNLNFIKHPWRYMFSANYNGLDGPPDEKTFSFLDWNLEIPFGKKGGWFTIGKQKEGVGHEYVAPGTQLMFMERGSGVPPLVRQRNIGVRYSNSILQHRATYTVGLFNNWWDTGHSFSDNGSQVTFRATGLPMYTSDRDFLHVAFGYRYSGAVNGTLSYKAKPEANTAPSFINTGTMDANNANTIMLEAIKVHEQFSFIAEYMYNVVGSSANGNPGFSYFTIGGGWFITGENRKYNKNTGNLGKLMPNKPFTFKKDGGAGAFELAARYTHSDFTDGSVDGGTLGRFTGAFSWYLNAHMRLSVNYGLGKLEKGSLKGDANFWQFRAQFEL